MVSLDPIATGTTGNNGGRGSDGYDHALIVWRTVTVTVRLEIRGLSSSDYALSPPEATIPAGERFTTFTISTIDDNVVEDIKYVNVYLRLVSPELNVRVRDV